MTLQSTNLKAVVGRPRKLQHEQIVAAALTVLEREGFAALSMRSLARELGVNHATLYNYVGHIDEVEQHALDALMARIPIPDAARPQPIRQQLIEHLLAVRRTQMLYPKFCHAPAGSPTWRLHMQCMARILDVCCERDDQIEDTAIAYNALIGLVATSAERSRSVGGRAPTIPDLEALAALPRDQFEPLFRPLRHGGYSVRLTAFAHRLNYLIDRLVPHLPSLDAATLDALERGAHEPAIDET